MSEQVDWKARAEAAEARVAELNTVKKNRGMSVNDGRVECPTCGDYVDGSVIKQFAPLNAENAALRERVALSEADSEANRESLKYAENAMAEMQQKTILAEGKVIALIKKRVDLCDAAMPESTSNEDAVDCIRATRLERDALREKLAEAEGRLADLKEELAACTAGCSRREDELHKLTQRLDVYDAALRKMAELSHTAAMGLAATRLLAREHLTAPLRQSLTAQVLTPDQVETMLADVFEQAAFALVEP